LLRILNVDNIIAWVDRYGGRVHVVIWPTVVAAMYVTKRPSIAATVVLPVVPVIIRRNILEGPYVHLDGLHIGRRVGLK